MWERTSVPDEDDPQKDARHSRSSNSEFRLLPLQLHVSFSSHVASSSRKSMKKRKTLTIGEYHREVSYLGYPLGARLADKERNFPCLLEKNSHRSSVSIAKNPLLSSSPTLPQSKGSYSVDHASLKGHSESSFQFQSSLSNGSKMEEQGSCETNEIISTEQYSLQASTRYIKESRRRWGGQSDRERTKLQNDTERRKEKKEDDKYAVSITFVEEPADRETRGYPQYKKSDPERYCSSL